MTFTLRSIHSRRFWRAAIPVAFLIVAGFAFSAAPAPMQQPSQESHATDRSREQSTSLNDQTDLAVTVYNSNIALVRDLRQLSLPSGAFRLKLMDPKETHDIAFRSHLMSIRSTARPVK